MSTTEAGPSGSSNDAPRVQQTSRSWKSASFVEQQRRQHAQTAVQRRHSEAEQLSQQQAINLWRFQEDIIRQKFPDSWLGRVSLPHWQAFQTSNSSERAEVAKRRAAEHERWIEVRKQKVAMDSNAYHHGTAFHLRLLVGVRGSVLLQGTIWRPRVTPKRSPHQVFLQGEKQIRPSPADDIAAWPSHAEASYEGQERQNTRTDPNFGRCLPLVRDWKYQYTEPMAPAPLSPFGKPWEVVPALPPYDFDRLSLDAPPDHCTIYPFTIGCPVDYPDCHDCRRFKACHGFLRELYICDEEGIPWIAYSELDDDVHKAAVEQYVDDLTSHNMEHFIPWDLLQAIDHPESYPAQAPVAEDTPFERYARQQVKAATYTGEGKGRMVVTPEPTQQEAGTTKDKTCGSEGPTADAGTEPLDEDAGKDDQRPTATKGKSPSDIAQEKDKPNDDDPNEEEPKNHTAQVGTYAIE